MNGLEAGFLIRIAIWPMPRAQLGGFESFVVAYVIPVRFLPVHVSRLDINHMVDLGKQQVLSQDLESHSNTTDS
jgi:hypothetical protein